MKYLTLIFPLLFLTSIARSDQELIFCGKSFSVGWEEKTESMHRRGCPPLLEEVEEKAIADCWDNMPVFCSLEIQNEGCTYYEKIYERITGSDCDATSGLTLLHAEAASGCFANCFKLVEKPPGEQENEEVEEEEENR